MVRQCKLLDISRSGLYYQPVGVSDEDLNLMELIDHQYMATPFYGARKISVWLKCKGQIVNRKRGAATDADDGPQGYLPASSDQHTGTGQ